MSISAIIGTLVGPVSDLLSEFIEDKDERARMAHKIATMGAEQAHAEALAQIEVNKEEAKSDSMFVAGWRPFIGWTGGLALANNYLLAPYVTAFTDSVVPVLDFSVMMPILMGMLGLGAARTYEKVKGVARNTMNPDKPQN